MTARGLLHRAAAIAALTLAATVAGQPASGSTLDSGYATGAAPGSVTDVRVLNWNIWLGGTGGGADNLPRVLDQIVAIAPDVFFAVETYGAGDEIRDALTERAGKGTYYSAQITPGNGIYQDNLWIFTRYPITHVYPKPTSRDISAFNFGGIRVRLPSGRELNLFDTWLTYNTPWIGDMIEQNAIDAKNGEGPTYSARRVANAEAAGLKQVDAILKELPVMLGGNTDPVVLAGDFNTVPASDWSAPWASCPSHFGLSYTLRTTGRMTGAGFTDSFRAANPDACGAPGGTWSPHLDMITPDRIDFTFTRGAEIAVTGAHTVDERLASHPAGPFYSDHAAVVSDLRIS